MNLKIKNLYIFCRIITNKEFFAFDGSFIEYGLHGLIIFKN